MFTAAFSYHYYLKTNLAPYWWSLAFHSITGQFLRLTRDKKDQAPGGDEVRSAVNISVNSS